MPGKRARPVRVGGRPLPRVQANRRVFGMNPRVVVVYGLFWSLGSREPAGCFRRGCQELAGDGGVSDGGGVVDAEHGGEVEGVGAAGEGLLELPVGPQSLKGGGQPAACSRSASSR